MDQDNPHRKFSALSADFSILCAYFVGSRRPAHASVKGGRPYKKWLFYRYWHIWHENSCRTHAVYYNKHCWRAV